MKKHILIASAAVVLIAGSSFTVLTDCSTFEQFNKGVTYTTTSYDAKGKAISLVECNVKEVITTGDKTVATIDVVMKDGKGEQTGTSTYDLTCSGSTYMMDLKSMATQQANATGAGKDMEMTIEGDMLEYPADMIAGQSLPGGKLTMTMQGKGSPMKTVTTIVIKDRKCEAVESKTTPAGTWQCYKITSTQEVTTRMGTITMPIGPRTSTEWFSFKVGAVRSESYKDGKLEGYSELTAFKKPGQ
jgi:hypothetical protein